MEFFAQNINNKRSKAVSFPDAELQSRILNTKNQKVWHSSDNKIIVVVM